MGHHPKPGSAPRPPISRPSPSQPFGASDRLAPQVRQTLAAAGAFCGNEEGEQKDAMAIADRRGGVRAAGGRGIHRAVGEDPTADPHSGPHPSYRSGEASSI